MSENHHTQNRVSHHFSDEAVAMAEKSYEAVGDAIRKEPMTATLAMFGVGLAIGTAAAVLITRKPQPKSRAAAMAGTMECIGRSVLDSIREALPDAVRQHLPR